MEMIIAITDNGPAIDNIKAGEVIAICPDGWAWTQEELTNPDWRIVRAPILPTHARTIMNFHTPLEQQVQGLKYPRKAYLIDFSMLPNPAQFSGQRADAIIALTNGQVIAASRKVA